MKNRIVDLFVYLGCFFLAKAAVNYIVVPFLWPKFSVISLLGIMIGFTLGIVAKSLVSKKR